MKNITLIIPAKEESESLPLVLKKLKKFNFKIMVVLHKSDKKTINSIKKFKIRIVYQNSIGYGDALIEGINKCSTEKDKRSFKKKFDKLWIHGFVHLFGHDHKKEKDFKKMHQIETNYLKLIK